MLVYRVLVVDDDPDDSELLAELLQQEGIESVLVLDSAQEVLSYLKQVEIQEALPELIITDLNMQGMTGVELLSTLKVIDRFCQIPVVLYSTSSYAMDVRRCLLCGARDYIVKPNTFEELTAVAAKLKAYLSGGLLTSIPT